MDQNVYLAALRREREGAHLAGKADRVAAIDAEIKRAATAVPPPVIESPEEQLEVETATLPTGKRTKR